MAQSPRASTPYRLMDGSGDHERDATRRRSVKDVSSTAPATTNSTPSSAVDVDYALHEEQPPQTRASDRQSDPNEVMGLFSISFKWLLPLAKLLAFHVANALLAIGAFVWLLVVLPVCMATLPLCCVGLLLFQMVLWVVAQFARADVWIANYFVSENKRIQLDRRLRPSPPDSEKRKALIVSVCEFPSCSLWTLLYFATLKFIVGLASVVTISFALVLPIIALATNATILRQLHIDQDSSEYVIISFACWIAGLLCVPFVALGSRRLTWCCCGERELVHPVSVPPVQTDVTTARYTVHDLV